MKSFSFLLVPVHPRLMCRVLQSLVNRDRICDVYVVGVVIFAIVVMIVFSEFSVRKLSNTFH